MNNNYPIQRIISALLISFLLLPLLAAREISWSREALEEAVINQNTALLIMETKESQADTQISLARAGFYPKVDFSLNLSYLANPDSYTIKAGELYPGSSSLPLLLPAEDYTVELSQSTHYEAGITIEQPLFTWGKLRNRLIGAELGVRAAQLEREIKQEELLTELNVLLYTLKILVEIKNENKTLIARGEDLLRLSEESHQNGFLLYSDLLAVRLQVKEAELAAMRIEDQCSRLLIRIRTLINEETVTLETIDFTSLPAVSGFPPEHKSDLLLEAMGHNRSLKLLEILISGARTKTRIARGAGLFHPNLGVYLNLTYTTAKVPYLEEDWDDQDVPNFIGTLGIRTLLFDGGASGAAVRSAQDAEEQARLELERGRESVRDYILTALFRMDLSQKKIEYHDIQMETAGERIEQKTRAWESGYGEERDIFQEKIIYHGHRIEELQEEAARIKTILELNSALGRTTIPETPPAY